MIALSGGLELDERDSVWLSSPSVGGVILFTRNFKNAAQLRRLSSDIRQKAGRHIVIAVDQEGGRVRRFRGGGFSSLPAAAVIGKDTTLCRAAGLVMAAELVAAGLDLSFAPVLDLSHGRSSVIGTRAFGSNVETVSQAAAAFADGMRAAGMACCGKHFPGHGYARADSHKTLPTDLRAYDTISGADLLTFSDWAKMKQPALMTAHVVYGKCDSQAATFSPFWLKTVLRGRLNFRGMIVSDDLAMAGADIGDMSERINAAISAGCDGLLVCQPAEIEEALSSVVATSSAKNPWLVLAAKPDNRVSIGDDDYHEAKLRLSRAGARN